MTGKALLLAAAAFLATLLVLYTFPDWTQEHTRTGWTTAGLSTSRDVPHDIVYHLLMTSGRTLAILTLGTACAILLAVLVGSVRSRVLLDVVILASAIPPLVWVPLGLAAFGLRSWAFDLPATFFVSALLAPALLDHARRVPTAPVDTLLALGMPRHAIRRRVLVPWVMRAVEPQLSLTLGLIFGVCTVVEYLSNFDGVGRVLNVITYYAEAQDIALLTAGSTGAVLLMQSAVRILLNRVTEQL